MAIYKKLLNVKMAGVKLKRDTKAYNYKYATLDQIQEKLGEILQKEQLVVIHYIDWWILTTEIRDSETDEFVKSELELTTQKPQDKGSEITYFRRYNLLSLLDLEVEDDDWKKAQAGEQKDEKPWFNKPQLENLEKAKSKYNNWDEALKVARSKYKVSNDMKEQILSIYE